LGGLRCRNHWFGFAPVAATLDIGCSLRFEPLAFRNSTKTEIIIQPAELGLGVGGPHPKWGCLPAPGTGIFFDRSLLAT